MVKRAVGGFCVPLGSLTGDALGRCARSTGRGERSARRQDGGAADRSDPRVARLARPRALLRAPSRRRGAPTARDALDRYPGLSSALDCAVDASVTGARGRWGVRVLPECASRGCLRNATLVPVREVDSPPCACTSAPRGTFASSRAATREFPHPRGETPEVCGSTLRARTRGFRQPGRAMTQTSRGRGSIPSPRVYR